MEYLKQFNKHLSNNDLPSIVSLWEEYCLCDEIDPEETKYILETLRASHLADSFGVYVDQILPLWEHLPDSKIQHEIFKLVMDIQTTNSPQLAEKALLYLQKHFEEDSEFQNKLRLVGLREKDVFQGAISNFELLNHLKPHNFVFHTGGWGVGEIMDVSFIREEISLEFDYVAGLKDLSFKNGFKTLIPIEKDHFLARRFGNPDQLEEQAKKDAVSVIKLLLKDLGPKTANEIKDELCDLVIPEENWQKWWQNTRSKLKKDMLVESPKNMKGTFSLRKSELSHEQRLQKLLEKKPDINTLIEIIYSFMRDFPSAIKNAEFKSTLILQLKDISTHKELSLAQELQLQFLLSDLQDESIKESILQTLAQTTNFTALINSIDVLAFKKQLLLLVKAHRKDWAQIFLNLFLEPLPNPTRDYVFQQLLKNGKTAELQGKIEELLAHPHHTPQAFLWGFNKITDQGFAPFNNQEWKNIFLETFFVLMHLLEREKDQKDLLKKMHSILTQNRYVVIRQIFENAPIEVVNEILLLSTKCLTLDEHDRKILHSLAEVVHPSLGKPQQESAEEKDVIWSTESGYLKLKERIHQIATVETVENAKEIEIARDRKSVV